MTLVVPRTGVDLAVTGGFIAEHREADADSRWVVYGSAGRAALIHVEAKGRRSPRHAAAADARARHRAGGARRGLDAGHVEHSARGHAGAGARGGRSRFPPGSSSTRSRARPSRTGTSTAARSRSRFLEPVATQASVVVTGEIRAPRDGAMTIPLVRVPSAERETGGVAVDVVGAGEIGGRQPRGLEPADASDLGDIVAGHESPSMVAFRFTPLAGAAPRSLTVHVTRYTAQGGARGQRRGGALRGAARARTASCSSARATRSATTSAASSRSRCRRGATLVERVAGGPAGAARACRRAAGCCCRCARGAPTRRRRRSSSSCSISQRGPAWTEKGDARLVLPARGSAGVAHRPDAAPLAALRRRSRSQARSGSRRIRGRGAPRCEMRTAMASRRRQLRRHRAAASAARRREGIQRDAGPVQEGGGPHAAGRHADRDRVSRDRAVAVSRGGADARDAAPRRSTSKFARLEAADDPPLSRLCRSPSLCAAAPAAAQDNRGPAGRARHRHAVALRIRSAARSGRRGVRSVRPAAPAAALTRADIRVRVAGATARATMRVDGEVFRAGVAKVTLMKDATLLDARMDNRPLPIVTEGGTHVALVTGPGPFSATLEVGTADRLQPGRARSSCRCRTPAAHGDDRRAGRSDRRAPVRAGSSCAAPRRTAARRSRRR